MNIISGVIKETWNLFLQMSPYLLLGFIVAGFVRVFLKPETIFRHLGRSGYLSILKAVILGVPLPLCSCGVLPPAATLYNSGATRGSVISFLIATPTTGIDSIFATYGLLGGIFMVCRLAVSVVVGFVAGMLVDFFSPGNNNVKKNISNEPFFFSLSTVVDGLKFAFFDLYGSIAKWVFWGVLIGGMIAYLVPDRFISNYLHSRYTSYLLMGLVGMPLYVCATGSIPIAASLIAKGMNPGAGLIFLIVGPATNTVTMLFVLKTLGKKSFMVYILTIVTGAFLSGWLLDEFTKNYDIKFPGIFHQHANYSAIALISAVVLIGFAVIFLMESLRRRCRESTRNKNRGNKKR